jgi:hypothetical protein
MGFYSLAANARDISEAHFFTNHRRFAYVICTGLAEIAWDPSPSSVVAAVKAILARGGCTTASLTKQKSYKYLNY